MSLLRGALFLLLAVAGSSSPTVLVTGATGKTGLLVYNMLKQKGVSVRGLVRNATKARDLLKCTKCDESEGIFVGDVTKKETLAQAMKGATALAIVTSAMPHCEDFKNPTTCSYPKGAFPKDVDFNGGKNQVEAFAEANNDSPGNVVLCSSMGTTEANSFLDKLGNGMIGFFKLNEEAFIMSSGVPYTIVKPCGLSDDEAGKRKLTVGHDDDMHQKPPMIPRADVARVMVEALLKPEEAAGLRFDLCSSTSGTPTTDISSVFNDARYPWQHGMTKDLQGPRESYLKSLKELQV